MFKNVNTSTFYLNLQWTTICFFMQLLFCWRVLHKYINCWCLYLHSVNMTKFYFIVYLFYWGSNYHPKSQLWFWSSFLDVGIMFPFTLTSAVPVLVIISWLDNIIGWVPWDWWLSAGQRSHPGSQRCHCNMAVTCSSMFEKSTFIYLFDICKLRMKMKTNLKMFLKTAAFRISLIFISACCTWCAFRRLLLNYNYQNLQWLLSQRMLSWPLPTVPWLLLFL